MSRRICYDVTHLLARLGIPSPSGIDKVDLAYGRHFAARRLGPGVHYGLVRPHVLSPERTDRLVSLAERSTWEELDVGRDGAFARLRAALIGQEAGRAGGRPPPAPARIAPAAPGAALRPDRHGLALRWERLVNTVLNDAAGVPANAIYLNVAQYAFEHDRFFRWLRHRPDVRAALLIHDLLPLDYAEYFRPRDQDIFERRVRTMLTYGRAFIVTTEAVRARIMEELARRGLPPVPMHVAPLPSTLGQAPAMGAVDRELARRPYFVILGTIEPRKNHLLLLNLWRHLAEQAGPEAGALPRLVVVGGRGWENEQILDVLDRGLLTRPHVIEASGLSTAGLIRLLVNARALLMPSFDEGYGLPLVEALSLGVPVVATDAPVFREVTQGRARYLSPIDGLGWRDAILALADADGSAARELRAAAMQFRPPTWEHYFAGLEGFLDSL